MAEKYFVIASYFIFLLFIIFSPYFFLIWSKQYAFEIEGDDKKKNNITFGLIIAVITICTTIKFNHFIYGTALIVVLVRLFYKSRNNDSLNYVLLAACSIALNLSLLWWLGLTSQQPPKFIHASVGSMIWIGIIGAYVKPQRSAPSQKVNTTLLGLSILFAFAFVFNISPFNDSHLLQILWHHWGAYIGPAELMSQGAKLFIDIPAQYGLGPAVALSQLCRTDCWGYAYYFFGIFSLLFTAVLLFIGYSYINTESSVKVAYTLTLILFASTLWISSPSSIGNPLMTPSVSGVRFLPLAIFIAVLITFNRQRVWQLRLGWICWTLSCLWSIESAFYCTIIWISAIFLDDNPSKSRRLSKIKQLSFIFISFIVFITFFTLYFKLETAHYLKYIFIYLFNPPGPLPINPAGPIWLYLIVIILVFGSACLNINKVDNLIRFRKTYIITLLNVCVFSYYLGRSHDNNILNLLPFLTLLIVDGLDFIKSKYTRTFLLFSSGAIIILPIFFNWTAWNAIIVSDLKSQYVFSKPDLSHFISRLSYQNESIANIITAYNPKYTREKTAEAIIFISQISNRNEAFILIDENLNIHPSNKTPAWNAIHSPANFAHISSTERSQVIQNVARKLKRSGWVIIDKELEHEWMRDFYTAYTISDALEGVFFKAFHLRPR